MTQKFKPFWKTALCILVFLGSACDDPTPRDEGIKDPYSPATEAVVTTESDPQEAMEPDTDPESDSAMSPEQALIEVGAAAVQFGKDVWDAKKRNDSIKMARRDKMYAYQLGVAFKDEAPLLDAYEKLSNQENVLAFKKSRKEYMLVLYKGNSLEEMKSELETYRDNYEGQITGEVKIIDLMQECGRRKQPKSAGTISKRKKKTVVECLTCSR